MLPPAKTLMLALLPAAAALVGPLRAPLRSVSIASSRPALGSRHLIQAMGRSTSFRMVEETAAAPTVPAGQELCLETGEEVEECTLVSWDAGKITAPQALVDKAKLGFLFGAWYFLNVMYNITNKRCQNVFPMPWTMTVVSLFVGIPWVLFLWATGLRKAPKISPQGFKTLIPIGFAHALGHAGAVIALGAGAVSFAQTVKAAEPLFTCVLSFLVLGTVFKWQVYASLIPIIIGVSLASLKELSFTMKALYGALTSNVAFASRAVLSKKTMDKPVGENMGAPNLYGVLTIIAFILTLPFAVYFEGGTFAAQWAASTSKVGSFWLTRQMALDGLYYYLYNEVAFIALDQVSPITHSIANTIKRVCIILATVLVFGNKLTTLGAIGSGIAVLGTFIYSIAKAKYK